MTPSPLTRPALRDQPVSRRCALLGVGGVGAAALLAACSSGGDDAASGGTVSSSAPGSSAAASPSTSSSAAAGATGSASAGAGGAAIAALSDVPVGGTAEVQVDGQNVLLSQPTAGKVEAFSSVCPHQGGEVKPNGDAFLCSLHKSEFDIDGKVTKGPARKDLTAVAVTVSGNDVVKA